MLVNITKMNEHFAGDEELIEELVEVFESSYPEVIRKLDLALVDKDPERIKLEAHTLKGMISNFFAEELRLCAFEIESRASELDINELNKNLETLKQKMPLMLKEIKNGYT